MKPEQQRIAIAEACGWTDIKRGPYDGLPFGRYKTHQLEGVPDFLKDLNAMHDAEKVLTDEQWPIYRDEIRLVVLGPIRMVSDWCKSDIHATASQRAEAFLRTIGKWEEAK